MHLSQEQRQELIEAITAGALGKYIAKNPTKALTLAGAGTYAVGSALRMRSAKKVRKSGHLDIPQYVQQAGVARGIKGLGKAAMAGALLASGKKGASLRKGLTAAGATQGAAGIAVGASAINDIRHAIRTKRKFRPSPEHKNLRKSYEYTRELRKTLR